MLIFYETHENLKEAFDRTNNSIYLLYVHYTIETKLLNRFPATEPYIFLYEEDNGKSLWIVLRKNLVYHFDTILFGCDPNLSINVQKFNEALFELDSKFPGFFNASDGPLVFGPENAYIPYEKWITENYPEIKFNKGTSHFFYMTAEQQKKLLALEITLPKEYNFGKLGDEDFEKIVLSREKGQPQDIPHIGAILTCMPSSIIKKNDEVVAYEMVDPSGFLKAQYVFPVHRGNGLGNAIERDLCKKCIRLGIMPNKSINEGNEIVLNATNRSPYWTRLEVNGSPVTFYFVKQNVEK